jgi:hypothetical protein
MPSLLICLKMTFADVMGTRQNKTISDVAALCCTSLRVNLIEYCQPLAKGHPFMHDKPKVWNQRKHGYTYTLLLSS